MANTESMAKNEDVVEIDLQELAGLLLHWLWLILGCGIATGVAGLLISLLLITPMYESTTSVYILDRDGGSGGVTYTDIQMGSVLTKDYAQLIKDRTVLEEVLGEFGLDEGYESLARRVKVEALTDTRIITVTVSDESPEVARALADEIRKVAAEHIKDVTAIEAVNVVEGANLPERPASPSVPKWAGIGALLGAFLCAAALVIRFLSDDTVKTGEDVERYLGLSTLALIPVIGEEAEAGKGKRGKARGGGERPAGERKEEGSLEEVF